MHEVSYLTIDNSTVVDETEANLTAVMNDVVSPFCSKHFTGHGCACLKGTEELRKFNRNKNQVNTLNACRCRKRINLKFGRKFLRTEGTRNIKKKKGNACSTVCNNMTN